ncbi:chemotaxis protein CheW [Myxococcota bacterium]|nr:chemotaxis protein CheW [Myxococcota bacterium]
MSQEQKETKRTIKVDMEVLDDLLRLVGELMINRDRYREVAQELVDELGNTSLSSKIDDSSGQLGQLTGELQDAIMRARMVPVTRIFTSVSEQVKEVSKEKGTTIELNTQGNETELDKNFVDALAMPLANFVAALAVNSKDDSWVEIRAERRRSHVVLTILSPVGATDLQRKALSTVVMQTGGTVDYLKTTEGTYFCTVSMPLTLAIIRVMMISVGDEIYAFPIESVKETLKINSEDIVSVKGTRVTELRGAALSLVFLDEFFGTHKADDLETRRVLVLSEGALPIGVVVDHLIEIREVVIKPLSQRFSSLREYSGSAILGDDQIALILNSEILVQRAIARSSMDNLSGGSVIDSMTANPGREAHGIT